MESESSYSCPCCGEEIVVPIDRSAGRVQEYVEDCPVCCRPLVLRVLFGDGGEVDSRSDEPDGTDGTDGTEPEEPVWIEVRAE